MTKRDLTALQLSQLSANLNPARVATRAAAGGGGKLSYLEAWDVRAALTRIFGYGGYSYDGTCTMLSLENDVPKRNGSGTQFRATVMARVRLEIPALGAYWEESAVSSQNNPDPGEALDFATKTAESDAFKRAAVNLGTQFGLSLYNNGATLDVVKVVREPHQAAILKRLAAGEKASEIDADLSRQGGGVDVTEPDDTDRDFSASEEGTQEVFPGAPAPGEDPRDDAPMALDVPPEASPESKAAALSTVRQGFNRGRA